MGLKNTFLESKKTVLFDFCSTKRGSDKYKEVWYCSTGTKENRQCGELIVLTLGGFSASYWVTQKLPQNSAAILRICIGKVAGFAVYICDNFWVTQWILIQLFSIGFLPFSTFVRNWIYKLETLDQYTGWPRSYRKYILQITQPSQYRTLTIQYKFAGQ